MDYTTLKTVHVACVTLSACGFVLRGLFALRDPTTLRACRLTRLVPHAVDSLLLASALAMVWQLGPGLLQAGWLQAKIVLLIAYIAFGRMALAPDRTRAARALGFALAIASLTGIAISALSKHPLGLS